MSAMTGSSWPKKVTGADDLTILAEMSFARISRAVRSAAITLALHRASQSPSPGAGQRWPTLQ